MLEFTFDEMIGEAKAFSNIADPIVLKHGRKDSVLVAVNNLTSFRHDPKFNSGADVFKWQIEKMSTLPTDIADASGKALRVTLTLAAAWPIKKVPADPSNLFMLAGPGITTIQLRRFPSDAVSRNWVSSVDGHDNLCLFGVQQTSLGPMIPRIPSLSFSPFTAFEFALSELAPTRWRKLSSGNDAAPVAWRTVQRQRLGRYLDWMQRQILTRQESPWVSVRSGRPNASIFV